MTASSRIPALLALLGALVPEACAAAPPLVELKVGGKAYQGRVDAHDDRECWLMGRDGRLERLAVNRIEAHRQVAAQFKGLTAAELRDQLRREVGDAYDVAGTEHYLVAAKKGNGEKFAHLFEDVYRSFHGHFSVRGFTMRKPEFPMVAIVCPDRDKFIARCRDDEVRYGPGLLGYYHPATNRVSLFDPGDQSVSEADGETRTSWVEPFDRTDSPLLAHARMGMNGEMKAGLRDTIIHETTHQVAFNTGLHTRIGETPRWVVEGLATVFEAPGVRDGGGRQAPVMQRINRERFLRFGEYAKQRRQAKSLGTFVSTDDMLSKATLDFYAEAWALTFYLTETRSSAYAKYLKTLAERDPIKPYPAAERLEEFRKAFGNDLVMLEADFLRHLERLNVE